MKNKLIYLSIISTVVVLSGCTSKTSTKSLDSTNQIAVQTPIASASSSATKATTMPESTFPASSDSDIKSIDKYFDNTKSTDFDGKAIDDIAK